MNNNTPPEFNMNPQPRGVTFKDTSEVVCSECQCKTFREATFLRKVSRILTGQPKDSYLPIPVFLCTACDTVCDEMLPVELQSELKKPKITL